MTAAVSRTLAVILPLPWIKSREKTLLLLRAVAVDMAAAAIADFAAATPLQFMPLLLLLLQLLQPTTHKALAPAPTHTVLPHASGYTRLKEADVTVTCDGGREVVHATRLWSPNPVARGGPTAVHSNTS